MLYLLTGDVQIGKTRWLEGLVDALRAHGTIPYGVLAPGMWVESESDHANGQDFEKLGIDNVLLPTGERLRFAMRTDLAQAEGTFVPESQAGREGLGWHISDTAIHEVNAYLSTIPQLSDTACAPGVLVIDELGRLELLRDQGLTAAMALLAHGPYPHIHHAILIARDVLADIAEERFASAWDGCQRIDPTDASRRMLLDLFSAC